MNEAWYASRLLADASVSVTVAIRLYTLNSVDLDLRFVENTDEMCTYIVCHDGESQGT